MKRTLYIKNYKEDGFPLNLFFTPDSVTSRGLTPVYPQNLDSEGKDIEYEKKKASALKSSLLIRENKDFTGKHFLIDGNLYKVERQTTIKLTKQLWRLNNEVCLAVVGQDGANLAFIDRNAQTVNGRETFSQLGKRMAISGARLAYRWVVLPSTNLLTAPVVAEPLGMLKLITNLDLGEPLFTSADMRLTPSQKEKADQISREFFSYWIPTLKVKGPSTIKVGGSAEFSISCTYKNGQLSTQRQEYMIEAISGYAPHTRVTLENGVGKFRVMALGLNKGELMRFKINDRNWTDKAELTLKVI